MSFAVVSVAVVSVAVRSSAEMGYAVLIFSVAFRYRRSGITVKLITSEVK